MKIDYNIDFLPNDRVSISKDYYEELLEDSNELQVLKDYGVDNWEGYSEAMCSLENDFK